MGCGLGVLCTVDCGVEPRVPIAFHNSLASRSVCGEIEVWGRLELVARVQAGAVADPWGH